MDKVFDVFVRQLPAGVAVSVLKHPHLASFAADAAAARADLAHVLHKLLERGELVDEETRLKGARLRRLELELRAVVARRLLKVPMRFSVVCHSEGQKKSLGVLVPRLSLSASLDGSDWETWVEEMIRNELHLAPLERLLALAYTGTESLETLTVSARPVEKKEKKPPPPRRAPPPPGLGEACRLLNDDATLERAFQRPTEMGLLEAILGARTRASVLLVGPSGAGKTALVHELAQRARDEGSAVHGLEVWSTGGGRIVAGMRYLGEWQARLLRMISSLRGRRAVLHIDSLGELLSVGRGGHEGLDLARFLVPAIEAGEIAVIVEASAEDVARAERSHAALVAGLRPIAVLPLGAGEAREALAQTAGQIAKRRRVKLDEAALVRAIDLAERFGDGALPGEAVSLLRAAAQPGAGRKVVGAVEVTAAFTARTGYPASLVDPAVRLDPAAVLAALRERVDGQDEATELLANLVVTLKTNLADPRRPLGSFLLLGPTGVGKTESALALAAYLFGDEKRLARFDMAEYAAPGSAARLVAASGGVPDLARRVREQPFGVVLLDEIEKADSGVHDLLLQVLGEGRLTDGSGRTVSFRNTIVILTSNLGADRAGRSLGFAGRDAGSEAHYRSAAAAFFRPELINRFDQIVPYRSLGVEVVRRLAARALAAALGREGVQRRGVRVEWSDAVVARLAEIGFDAALGARPLKRAVETHVIAPLARLLARMSSVSSLVVRVEVDASGAIVLR